MATFVADREHLAEAVRVLKYGTGPLDSTLVAHNLVDEFHFLLTPVAVGRGQHLFEDIETPPQLALADVTRFGTKRCLVIYTQELSDSGACRATFST